MEILTVINSFKVIEDNGNTRIEMTGNGLLAPRDGEMIPDARVWYALSGVIAEAAGITALVHSLTDAFNNGRATIHASKDGNGLIFVFNEGSIPDIIKQTLVQLDKDEPSTLTRLNAAVAQGKGNAQKFRSQFL